MPLTNPSTATHVRKYRSVGTRHQNTYSAITSDARLTKKYVVRRPTTLAIHPPSRLPTMPVSARIWSTSARSDALPAFSAHGVIQFAVPHPPTTGVVARTIPTSVSHTSGGR